VRVILRQRQHAYLRGERYRHTGWKDVSFSVHKWKGRRHVQYGHQKTGWDSGRQSETKTLNGTVKRLTCTAGGKLRYSYRVRDTGRKAGIEGDRRG
jgi:hypothetical protein